MNVPGAVMLLRTPKGEFTVTYGQRGLDDPTPVTVNDHIRIGSNTKTWTGSAILQMVQEGKIAIVALLIRQHHASQVEVHALRDVAGLVRVVQASGVRLPDFDQRVG
jgi:hypothetical protein